MSSNLSLSKETHGEVKRLKWVEKIRDGYGLKSKLFLFKFKFEFKHFELKFKLKYLNLNLNHI